MPFTIQSAQSIHLNTAAQLTGGTVALVLSMDNEEVDGYTVTKEYAKDAHLAFVTQLERDDDGWHFNVTATGFNTGLVECIRSFGINI